MRDKFIRSQMMFGKDAMYKLNNARVAVFGLGGVGGYVIEALARGGVGNLDIVDHDKIDITNINRQILSNENNIGIAKVVAAKERLLSINPDININVYEEFFLSDTAEKFNFCAYDYVVDAIDTVTAKLLLAEMCYKASTPIISVMGTGNKKDATRFKVCDIFETSICPLARVMRKELKARNILKLKVVYSDETPISPEISGEISASKVPVSSNSFVPAVAGLIAAGEVIKDIIAK